MEINNFILKVAEQYENTDSSIFTKDTHFKDVDEWSSLISLYLIAMVDKDYHVRIKGDDIRQATTIEDLFKIVNSRV